MHETKPTAEQRATAAQLESKIPTGRLALLKRALPSREHSQETFEIYLGALTDEVRAR